VDMLYDKDADLSLLEGQTVAVIGFGSQGHAHSQNLRDSGVKVVVAEAPGTAAWDRAAAAGFEVLTANAAAAIADIVMMLVPDQTQKVVYETAIRDNLREGDMLMFAHGFNIHYNQIIPPAGVDVTMIAPKGPGHLVRRVYTEGGGVPALLAVYQDATGKARDRALAYAKGLGALRAGADIVRVASPVFEPVPDLIFERLEGRVIAREHLRRLKDLARNADVVVMGNGLGDQSHDVMVELAAACRKAVVDADALRCPLPRAEDTIYTPHAGEFTRAFGREPPGDLVRRARAVKEAAGEGGAVLLKGHVDIISDGRRVRFNRAGSPLMTVGERGTSSQALLQPCSASSPPSRRPALLHTPMAGQGWQSRPGSGEACSRPTFPTASPWNSTGTRRPHERIFAYRKRPGTHGRHQRKGRGIPRGSRRREDRSPGRDPPCHPRGDGRKGKRPCDRTRGCNPRRERDPLPHPHVPPNPGQQHRGGFPGTSRLDRGEGPRAFAWPDGCRDGGSHWRLRCPPHHLGHGQVRGEGRPGAIPGDPHHRHPGAREEKRRSPPGE